MSESHEMTWKEFKELLNKQEIPDNATIDWIDFSYPEVYPDGVEGWKSIDVYYDENKNIVTVH